MGVARGEAGLRKKTFWTCKIGKGLEPNESRKLGGMATKRQF